MENEVYTIKQNYIYLKFLLKMLGTKNAFLFKHEGFFSDPDRNTGNNKK